MRNNFWNMLANIKNGQKANKSFILHPRKTYCALILNILWEEGFILGYKISKQNSKMLEIFLKYKQGIPVIKNLMPISKPSQRVYCSSKQLWKLNSNLGLYILSTNKGILSLNTCKKLNIGGELILIIN
jgi:small subunit ribosomal protein S8